MSTMSASDCERMCESERVRAYVLKGNECSEVVLSGYDANVTLRRDD